MTEEQKQLLEQMRNSIIFGNAFNDGDLWSITHKIAIDKTMPMKHRLESLAKMNELTGESEPCTIAALDFYVKHADEIEDS